MYVRTITEYKCESCGKKYRSKAYMERHEKYCKMKYAPACIGCSNLLVVRTRKQVRYTSRAYNEYKCSFNLEEMFSSKAGKCIKVDISNKTLMPESCPHKDEKQINEVVDFISVPEEVDRLSSQGRITNNSTSNGNYTTHYGAINRQSLLDELTRYVRESSYRSTNDH